MVDDTATIHKDTKYRIVNADQKDSRETRVKTTMPSEIRSVSVSDWLTVGILCFVNLINYMDRFTVAGKFFR